MKVAKQKSEELLGSPRWWQMKIGMLTTIEADGSCAAVRSKPSKSIAKADYGSSPRRIHRSPHAPQRATTR